ncbi:hypothetical protein FRB99_002636 [Tulasnella sp. 403]|nr:hypothetical protein FRB99_002636 [Tulasnella sp. 403]
MVQPMLDPLNDSPYGYIPTEWICIMFLVFYSLTTIVHAGQAFHYRLWWLFPTMVACGFGEILGWSGRLWSSLNPWLRNPFLIQICCTIIAPSFMTAAMFIMFGRIMNLIGPQYSRLSMRLYSIIFVGGDLAALTIQGIGGGSAASADTNEGAENGAHIMVAGIIVQMAAVTFYVLIQIDYFWHVLKNRPARSIVPAEVATPPAEFGNEKTPSELAPTLTGPQRLTKNIKIMMVGLTIATVFIYIRSIYRTIELLDGWNGPIFVNEKLFNGLDGAPIFLAMLTLNIFHAGHFIPFESQLQRKISALSQA